MHIASPYISVKINDKVLLRSGIAEDFWVVEKSGTRLTGMLSFYQFFSLDFVKIRRFFSLDFVIIHRFFSLVFVQFYQIISLDFSIFNTLTT